LLVTVDRNDRRQLGGDRVIVTERDGAVFACDDGTVLHISSLGGCFGARVTGIDLSQPLHPSVVAALEHAFVVWHILCFPGQDLEPEDEIRIIQYFDDGVHYDPSVVAYAVSGYPEIDILSNIEVDGKAIGYTNRRGMEWHSDLSGMPVMPKASLMYAIEVPESGGETYFANGHLAYESLPAERREYLDGVDARYSWAQLQEWLAQASGTWKPMSEADAANHPDVVRSLVRYHPVTGRKALFFSIEEIVELTGLDRSATRGLLEDLIEHMTATPHVVYRHDWEAGEVVVWDNRCLMHSVCEYNYEGQRRLMHQLNGADARSAEQTIAVIPTRGST
jgi:taurine dioxygenase